MNILILSAFKEEQAYYQRTYPITESKLVRFVEVDICHHHGNTLYFASTGMGTINAALVLATLANALTLDFIFFSGTSGGITPIYELVMWSLQMKYLMRTFFQFMTPSSVPLSKVL